MKAWKGEDPVTGERLQSIAEATVLTRSILSAHQSLPKAGVRNVVLFPGGHRTLDPDSGSIAALRGRRIIFVYSHLLDSFFHQILPRLDHRFVLISHNSDVCVDAGFLPALEDPRIAHWFAQNALVSHRKLTPLPIGIANAQWNHGRIDDLIAAAAAAPASRKDLIYCNFNERTNPARVRIKERLAASDAVWMAPSKPFRRYLGDMARCRWCVSPPGNGADCHRTWEALYLGVAPVIASESWNPVLHAGLPIIHVGDLGALSRASIHAEQGMLDERSFDLDRLAMGYWRKRIGDAAEEAGRT